MALRALTEPTLSRATAFPDIQEINAKTVQQFVTVVWPTNNKQIKQTVMLVEWFIIEASLYHLTISGRARLYKHVKVETLYILDKFVLFLIHHG